MSQLQRDYYLRRTKIVCTIGPATESEAQLEKLVLAGMNVARLNFSHGAHEEHAAVVDRVRRISERLSIPVAILLDLQGPKILGRRSSGRTTDKVDRWCNGHDYDTQSPGNGL